MKRKEYIEVEKIPKKGKPEMSEVEKQARIYNLARKLKVKIGGMK